ncbi:tRNA (adenosine(37)-N6)-threonylcarbamoyltransferase complex dimerization subunit type 1 TsaB [Pseudoxanthomonas broegbernensis]|uniref:tRNA threonylcarbamoyladenosine biosynthesis protein TsaB n=1 Tax=Pseudoxanthomonas broegbernensis TaxID=83619 RepID=A0A7V8GMJ8_9GAMM|nr:tRNA (adenosine(37)-N6)-threonylcarbamoyltransferase complex dimerization subunit type 1 TsaB [Pseudoxanthomonas broegbernensis]KAF1686537.1 tRNA (adenosine(37)-N6)-threonylcarbamoyltransferase complex dimerization subunit type 1 TsaB [Pseudoxanthomonas broegbernensis]MBB6064201.1 tRNA threonylcarbamoyladenosine biosynthesis protein TsaB [Pseudoxanthomonas broegbernensis]
MKLLAFETATEACSVALYLDGEVHERFEIAPRRHAELALPWAEALLAEAGIARARLDAIAVGRGPGAFTGVRLGIALAQGIALALDLPVVPVSTLAVLAAGAHAQGPERILAAIDARMGEVYVGAFLREGDAVAALGAERVLRPEAVALAEVAGGGDAAWQGVGTGFAAAEGVLARHLSPAPAGVDAQALPRAATLARLAAAAHARGQAVAPERAEPAYLRDNVALTLAEQQALRGSRRPA